MKRINKETSIYKLSKEYPEILDIMVELGFKDIVKQGMLQSVGRIMTLQKGSDIKRIPMTLIKEVFLKHGFTIE